MGLNDLNIILALILFYTYSINVKRLKLTFRSRMLSCLRYEMTSSFFY